jgi:hypothetical protein
MIIKEIIKYIIVFAEIVVYFKTTNFSKEKQTEMAKNYITNHIISKLNYLNEINYKQ